MPADLMCIACEFPLANRVPFARPAKGAFFMRICLRKQWNRNAHHLGNPALSLCKPTVGCVFSSLRGIHIIEVTRDAADTVGGSDSRIEKKE